MAIRAVLFHGRLVPALDSEQIYQVHVSLKILIQQLLTESITNVRDFPDRTVFKTHCIHSEYQIAFTTSHTKTWNEAFITDQLLEISGEPRGRFLKKILSR